MYENYQYNHPKKVRKCAKRAMFLPPNLRTRTMLVNLNKMTTKRWSFYFGRAICTICEMILFVICCCLGKK